MNQSYVGVITAHGLQAIYQESDHVVQFLDRQLYRKKPFFGLCCWAVIADHVAEQIEFQIRLGDSKAALRVLQEYADFLGPILPRSEAKRAAATMLP